MVVDVYELWVSGEKDRRGRHNENRWGDTKVN